MIRNLTKSLSFWTTKMPTNPTNFVIRSDYATGPQNSNIAHSLPLQKCRGLKYTSFSYKKPR